MFCVCTVTKQKKNTLHHSFLSGNSMYCYSIKRRKNIKTRVVEAAESAGYHKLEDLKSMVSSITGFAGELRLSLSWPFLIYRMD